MTLTPDATKILELCPRLESLRWRIINTRSHYLGPRQAVLIDLLPVPCTVTHLDLMQDILTRVSPGSIQTALSNAPGLNKMTLHTLYETAEQALRTIGSQIKALNLCIWGQQQSKMPASRLNSLFALVPNLTSLRLFTLSYDQLAEALFPPKVERLTFDTLHFHAVEKIMDLLATEPTWCPHLSNLPQFTSITSIDVLHGTVSGRGRLQAFRELCRRATSIIERRPKLRGRESEFSTLINRVSPPSSGVGIAPIVASLQPNRVQARLPHQAIRRRRSRRSRNLQRRSAADALRRWRTTHRQRQRTPPFGARHTLSSKSQRISKEGTWYAGPTSARKRGGMI